jgi:probable rRNA maturation factor
MKLTINLQSNLTKLSTKQQGQLKSCVDTLSSIFSSFLKANPHLKRVKELTLSLTLCGKTKIRSLNKNYRNKDKITDVLSFGVYSNLRHDRGPFQLLGPLVEIGDIFICFEVCQKQANEFGIEFKREFSYLAIHGFLHLLGYDHELSSSEEKLMQKYEDELNKKLDKLIGKV